MTRRHARRLRARARAAASKRRQYITALDERRSRQARQAAAIAAGSCINENQARTHGPATHGCRCAGCHTVYLRTA